MHIKIESIDAKIVDISTKEKQGILIESWKVQYEIETTFGSLFGFLTLPSLPEIPKIYQLIEIQIKNL